jgi:hypothetical protein
MSGRSNTTALALTAVAAIGAGTVASYFVYKYFFGKKYKGNLLHCKQLNQFINITTITFLHN